MSDLIEDIVELQTRIQFQEDTIQKLDEVVIGQGEMLDRMKLKISELEEQIEQLAYACSNPGGISSADEKPPHY